MQQLTPVAPVVDDRDTIEPNELRDLARVIKASLGILTAYWKASNMPAQHPYRQAARMVVSYLERQYDV